MTVIQLVGAALVAIPAVLGILQLFARWFTTPLAQKEQTVKDDVRKKMDDFEQTGRPKW